ncbi:AbrB/MazE/SpoVT family DNA-binding domain-containing protein [Candidatus Saccharibacteria bacterium]|nr:AbrB/MazE/SpoVT family DNA-binding domain-containing protein [Candidatus Saccharibacteria bacterium]MCB9821727.1 AbrB/MazE/SpoVT family DNA-binding domain-containing protein [Candidatus Nomurabacteria bacterium]
MGTVQSGKEAERKLIKNSNGTYLVTLPLSLVRELHWQQGQKLVIKRVGQKLVVEDWQEN